MTEPAQRSERNDEAGGAGGIFARAFRGGGLSRPRRAALGLLATALAAAVWLPCVHLFFVPARGAFLASGVGISPGARALAARHLKLWSAPEHRKDEIARMRVSNAEWDFMGRTFLVLALANMALREPPSRAATLKIMDRIIDDTLRLEEEKGMYFFLMRYARAGKFVQRPARSLFVDGEIALMLGARRLVGEKARYRDLHTRRVSIIAGRMQRGPVRCAESYPDECWTFCNAAALAAIKIADALDGTDHRELFRQWLRAAKERLMDPATGILNSSFTLAGAAKDGPEGSSIWFSAHCLQLIDEELAREQYRLARAELGRVVLGFGYAREWPVSRTGPPDVDSGPIVPLLEASPGSSGLALLAAAAFGDSGFHGRLCTSLQFAAFPTERDGELRYATSNQVGDAVMLYSMVVGPLWREVKRRSRR